MKRVKKCSLFLNRVAKTLLSRNTVSNGEKKGEKQNSERTFSKIFEHKHFEMVNIILIKTTIDSRKI